MYICICNAIRETDLRDAARRTGGDVCSVYSALGKRPNCGQCLEDAAEMIAQEREVARPVTIAA